VPKDFQYNKSIIKKNMMLWAIHSSQYGLWPIATVPIIISYANWQIEQSHKLSLHKVGWSFSRPLYCSHSAAGNTGTKCAHPIPMCSKQGIAISVWMKLSWRKRKQTRRCRCEIPSNLSRLAYFPWDTTYRSQDLLNNNSSYNNSGYYLIYLFIYILTEHSCRLSLVCTTCA
jgi:hypothetical protein